MGFNAPSKISLIIIFVSSTCSLASHAATCSCAGVPLASSAQLLAKDPGEILTSISYSYHDISDLVAGSEEVNDETGRNRETQVMLFQVGYGINEYWSIGALTSYIEHTRQIEISNQSEQQSSGIGDSMLSLAYSPSKIGLFNRDEYSIGIGLRIPTGVDDNGSPVFIEDMQPGQGAWGGSGWAYWGHAFNQQASWKSFTSINYAHTNTNDRDYSFEGEWNAAAGINYTAENNWAYAAALEWRKADAHTRFGGDIPNTGGRWINFTPSVQYNYNEATALKFSATVPVDRELNGTLQFTTKQSFSLALIHSFK